MIITLDNNKRWTYSECISNAAAYQQKAWYWFDKMQDWEYQNRFRMSTQQCEWQAEYAANEAEIWYERARLVRGLPKQHKPFQRAAS